MLKNDKELNLELSLKENLTESLTESLKQKALVKLGFNSLLIAMVLLLSAGCISLSPSLGPLKEQTLKKNDGPSKIAMINISGPIMNAEKSNFFGQTLDVPIVARIQEELDLIKEDDKVRAVLLRINSPGGAVTACDMIYHQLMKFKKQRKVKIIAIMEDVAASGGVYIAMAADYIIAHPTTVTGSIGVIAQKISLEGLMEKIGVSDETVKSGQHKDMGSLLRKMKPGERQLFQDVINSMYGRFLDVIIEGRGNRVNKLKLRQIADGRIFTAKTALHYGLIDQIGYLDDAIAQTEKMAKIKNAQIVTYARPGKYTPNVYSGMELTNNGNVNIIYLDASMLGNRYGMQFLYMWVP